jgi:hypothetical protein
MTGPVTDAFRCAAASEDRDEPQAGTASTVRAFLLVEAPGPWGVDAIRGSRLPAEVRDWLAATPARDRVRPLLIRRHRRRGAHPPGETRVFAAFADRASAWMETAVLRDPRELLDLDIAPLGRGASPQLTPYPEPVYLVCTHGRHDACCAERGRPLCAAITKEAPEQTWEVSHIGGDRFAANLLVLPDGLYYGRLTPADAPGFVAAHRRGELDLDHLRGRCAYPFPVQSAEIHLRRELGITRADAAPLLGVERAGDLTRAAFDVDGTEQVVTVRAERQASHRLTCRAASAQAVVRYSLVSVTAGVSSDPVR